ncbi:hypothetical protein [Methylobacterium sp. GC_Met_2]|uniref:hypothetical protein n=1 Tax=Methylobacterium sp. GC_Met_2 TaxID=2937376 RepID=UPI00226B8BBB|nr:hypothetical protein [Methylobacterium sp. GC_Met_2]
MTALTTNRIIRMLFMATHAHSTRTPLLPPSRSAPPLLGQGLGRQSGPVTQAIRAMRAAEPLPPVDAAIEAIREGLIRYFVEEDSADRQRVRELRRQIADRIEADLALLDALDPDTDLEDSGDVEPSLCGLSVSRPSYGGDDREYGDDNGIADWGGEVEQNQRFQAMGGDLNAYARRFA